MLRRTPLQTIRSVHTVHLSLTRATKNVVSVLELGPRQEPRTRARSSRELCQTGWLSRSLFFSSSIDRGLTAAQSVELFRKHFGKTHSDTLSAEVTLATILYDEGIYLNACLRNIAQDKSLPLCSASKHYGTLCSGVTRKACNFSFRLQCIFRRCNPHARVPRACTPQHNYTN